MYQQFNEQFAAATRQFADTAAQFNRIALENAEAVFGLQMAALEERTNATFAFFGEVAEVRDPEAMKNVQGVIGDQISYAQNEYDALKDADALLICTEWGVFRNPDFDKMKSLMKDPVIFDGRNLFEISEMNTKGFYYSSIGRSIVSK